VYLWKQSLFHLPQPFMSSEDANSGNLLRTLGTPALKEWQEMEFLPGSQMSENRDWRMLFSFFVVRNFPFGRVKTGTDERLEIGLSCMLIRRLMAFTGHTLWPLNSKMSKKSPSLLLDFGCLRWRRILPSALSFTQLQVRVAEASKLNSSSERSSPILAEEKKATVQAVQIVWMVRGSQLVLFNLWPRCFRSWSDMALLVEEGGESEDMTRFPAPFNAAETMSSLISKLLNPFILWRAVMADR